MAGLLSARGWVWLAGISGVIFATAGCGAGGSEPVSVGQEVEQESPGDDGLGEPKTSTGPERDETSGSAESSEAGDLITVTLGDFVVDLPSRFVPTLDLASGGGVEGSGSYVSQLFVDDEGVELTVSVHKGIDLPSHFSRSSEGPTVTVLEDGRSVYSLETFGSFDEEGLKADGVDVPQWIEVAVDLGGGASLFVVSPELSPTEMFDLLLITRARQA